MEVERGLALELERGKSYVIEWGTQVPEQTVRRLVAEIEQKTGAVIVSLPPG